MPDDLANRVEITADPDSASLRIGGHLVPFTAAVLRLEAPKMPVLSVALPVIGGAVVTLDAKCEFEESTAAALVAAGWVPPGNEPLARLREAVQRVLDDEESQHPGGWGPDVTMVGVLREAMEATAP